MIDVAPINIIPVGHTAIVWEDQVIHVIKTGFKDKYMLVYEDAYEQVLGNTEIISGKDLKKNYNINPW